MARRWWAIGRAAAGLGVLALLAWRVGAEPFATGLRAISPGAIVLAVLAVAVSTVCCSVRWCLVARGAGVELTLGRAVAAYYRSQFLNSVLPGGVLGDVHRGLAHRTVRSVIWDRLSGQSVQIAASLVVLAWAWPTDDLSGLSRTVMVAAGLLLVVATVAVLRGPGHLGLGESAAVVVVSCVATSGYVAVLVVAAHATGATAGPGTLLPVALVVLLAAALPLNVAGWGPREGAAAWVFALVGLGAAAGTATAVAYGVLSLIAVLPGALLLLRRPRALGSSEPSAAPVGSRRARVGASHG